MKIEAKIEGDGLDDHLLEILKHFSCVIEVAVLLPGRGKIGTLASGSVVKLRLGKSAERTNYA